MSGSQYVGKLVDIWIKCTIARSYEMLIFLDSLSIESFQGLPFFVSKNRSSRPIWICRFLHHCTQFTRRFAEN